MDVTKCDNTFSRRSFLTKVSLFSGFFFFRIPTARLSKKKRVLRFGLIADVHQDVMHDGSQRVKAFTDAMNKAKPDFIFQLGDFCQPQARNRGFLEQWRQFNGPRYHVLGNHDMDGGFTREQTVAYLSMPGKHYSFDKKGIHVVVLDGNEPGGKSKGYKRYIADEQLRWLTADLKATPLPTIVFSHQTLDSASGVENSEAVRKVLEAARTETGQKKVVACFCGHHHDDQTKIINGIHYLRINSASYLWLGSKYKHESYSKEIHRQHPWISHTAPYKDALWAWVEIDPEKGSLIVKGRTSTWVGSTPWQLGADKKALPPNVIGPRISNRGYSFWEEDMN